MTDRRIHTFYCAFKGQHIILVTGGRTPVSNFMYGRKSCPRITRDGVMVLLRLHVVQIQVSRTKNIIFTAAQNPIKCHRLAAVLIISSKETPRVNSDTFLLYVSIILTLLPWLHQLVDGKGHLLSGDMFLLRGSSVIKTV